MVVTHGGIKYYTIDNYRIPIIIFNEEFSRYILVKTVSHFVNMKTYQLNSILDRNKFVYGDIRQFTEIDDELRKKLLLTGKESGKNVKKIYILNQRALNKLVKILNCDVKVHEKLNIVFNNDIELVDAVAEEVTHTYLDIDGINRLYKNLSSNEYIRDIYNCLRCPKQPNIALKKRIREFKDNIRKEANNFLIRTLDIDTIYNIPKDLLNELSDYFEKGFVLSDELEMEYKLIRNEINDFRDTLISRKRKNSISRQEKLLNTITKNNKNSYRD